MCVSYPELDGHCDGPAALKPLEEGARAFLLQDLAKEQYNREKEHHFEIKLSQFCAECLISTPMYHF